MIKELRNKIKDLEKQIDLEKQKIGYLEVFERELLGLKWGQLSEFQQKMVLYYNGCTVECKNSKFRTIKSEQSGDVTVNTVVKNCAFNISRNLRVKGKLICYEHIDKDGCLIDWFETRVVDSNSEVFCWLKEYTAVPTPKLEKMFEEYKELLTELDKIESGDSNE